MLLNKFPYSSGHLMVASYRHVGEFAELTDEEALEVHRLAQHGMAALAETYAPQGYNLGWNSAESRVPASSTTFTSTSSPAGRATRTSCPSSPT